MSMTNQNDSVIDVFITESREHFEQIEPDLLILEEQGGQTDQEIINRVFRGIHSIKGVAGFLGFDAIKNLGHNLESVLMLIRDGKLDPLPEVVDVLIQSADKLQDMIEDVHASNDMDYDDEHYGSFEEVDFSSLADLDY